MLSRKSKSPNFRISASKKKRPLSANVKWTKQPASPNPRLRIDRVNTVRREVGIAGNANGANDRKPETPEAAKIRGRPSAKNPNLVRRETTRRIDNAGNDDPINERAKSREMSQLLMPQRPNRPRHGINPTTGGATIARRLGK